MKVSFWVSCHVSFDLLGPTAGINVLGALWMAKQLGPGKIIQLGMTSGHTIVTILCDGGRNYLSKAFSEEWLKEKGVTVERDEPQSFLDAFDLSKLKVTLPK